MNFKKIMSTALASVMALSLAVPAFAADVTNPAADLPIFTANVAALFPALNAFVPNVFMTGTAFEPKSRMFL